MYRNLGEVKQTVDACKACDLCKTRINTVFGEGSLHAKVMLIGEGPGAQEDRTGRPFVGPAGQLLDRMLAAIELSRNQVYIANIVKCRPPGNADPKPEYAKSCIGYLREQVRFIHPKVLVLLGRIAMNYILDDNLRITQVHGKIFERKNFYIIPTFHPSALLRNEDLKRPAWEDFKTIRNLLAELEHGKGPECNL